MASSVMDRGTDRTVIHDGRVVADQLERLWQLETSMHYGRARETGRGQLV